MAKNETVPHSPTVREMEEHVHDYDRFLTMMKWGAIFSFLVGFIVVVFVLK